MGLLKNWEAEGILSPEAHRKLNLFADLILEWNPKINLTGFRTRSEIEEILFGEAILAARAFPLTGKRVLDVGSGAGIPGLVWCMSDPTIQLTSLEIRAKKIAFQKEVVRSTGVQAEIVRGLFPEAVSGRLFDVLATRAIRFDVPRWEQARDFVAPGGALIRFGSAGDTPRIGWESIPVSARTSLLVIRF